MPRLTTLNGPGLKTVAYIVGGTHFRAMQARGMQISKIFSDSQITSQMLSNEVSHAPLRAPLSKRSCDTKIITFYIDRVVLLPT